MPGFRNAQARAYRKRRQRRAFQRSRFRPAEVAEAFGVGLHVVMYAIRGGKVPFEKASGKLWLNSESVQAVIRLGHHLRT